VPSLPKPSANRENAEQNSERLKWCKEMRLPGHGALATGVHPKALHLLEKDESVRVNGCWCTLYTTHLSFEIHMTDQGAFELRFNT
jgi:hypothetical protein